MIIPPIKMTLEFELKIRISLLDSLKLLLLPKKFKDKIFKALSKELK